MKRHQTDIPSDWATREALREKGQFWTPSWIAEAMVAYVIADGNDKVFDPAVGAGAFFRAARTLELAVGRCLDLAGTEIDPSVLVQARQAGLTTDDLARVQITDFVLRPPQGPFKAIVANPPYVRHHRLSIDVKAQLRALAVGVIGRPLDGRAGLHVYFLLRALQLLGQDGRLAFIVPADTCEGVFAPILWSWIANKFRLEAVVTFAPEASPFPSVDTNPVILMIRKSQPQDCFQWVKCTQAATDELKEWVLRGPAYRAGEGLMVHTRRVAEALATGLSREPNNHVTKGPLLSEFASVVRGVATGANDFFFLTTARARELDLPEDFLVRAVGRTRDIAGDTIDQRTLADLDAAGRPTLLFSPDGRPIHMFPSAVQRYLRRGEEAGLPVRPLIATRNPWYKMEVRSAPPILFAYLGRRRARFIRNIAGVVPLTGFLCVYPHCSDVEFITGLWDVLRHPQCLANLPQVGKSYGSGAIKVEPRALERLALPADLVEEHGLSRHLMGSQLALAI